MERKIESRTIDLNLKHDSLVSRIENLYNEEMRDNVEIFKVRDSN